jgi:tRNA-uridine 2-sulfurtransferase
VLRLEPERRRVVVGPRAALAQAGLTLTGLNWLGDGAMPSSGIRVTAKLRSSQPPVPATLYPGGTADTAELVPVAPAGTAAPGQAAVCYDGERVLGGGWIRRRDEAAA